MFTLHFSRYMSAPLYARLIARWRHGKCRASEIFNVGTTECGEQTSWGSEVSCKRPSGVRGGAPEKKYVSKYFHGVSITINSMILYFKHIIHINDFPLNGHPPILYIKLRRSRDVFVLSFVCFSFHRMSFSSLWPAFTLTLHIDALYNESVHRKEQRTSGINQIP